MSQHWVAPVGDVAAATAVPLSASARVDERSELVDEILPARAARAIGLSLVAGVLAQMLFVGQLAGINVLLWVGLVMAAALVVRRPSAHIDRLDLWLPVLAIVFAGFVAMRDEAMLFLFDLPMAGALTLASVVALGGLPLTKMSVAVVSRAGAVALLVAAIGAAFLAPGIRQLTGRMSMRASPRLSAVARGLLVALPLLLLFGVLFATADAIFATQLGRLLSPEIDTADALRRTAFAVVAGWAFAGTMVAAWLVRQPTAAAAAETPAEHQGRWGIEALVVLLMLDALFAAFALIQAAYLFGGLDTLAVSGLTYADYARRGFFELVAVATLVGVVLLVVGRRVEPSRSIRAAAVALAVLTGAVLASAALRLSLYQAAYGWTELRFYVACAIVWLALCLAAAAIALATTRTGWLLHAWLTAGLVVALVVNGLGPHAFVTARNVERAIDPSLVAPGGRAGLDVGYFRWLGADAVPVLVAARDRLPPFEAAEVDRLLRDWAAQLRAQAAGVGWPSWNLSRVTALDWLTEAGY